jgi:hypothetical protein
LFQATLSHKRINIQLLIVFLCSVAASEADHAGHLIGSTIAHWQPAMQALELPIYHPTYEGGLRAARR